MMAGLIGQAALRHPLPDIRGPIGCPDLRVRHAGNRRPSEYTPDGKVRHDPVDIRKAGQDLVVDSFIVFGVAAQNPDQIICLPCH